MCLFQFSVMVWFHISSVWSWCQWEDHSTRERATCTQHSTPGDDDTFLSLSLYSLECSGVFDFELHWTIICVLQILSPFLLRRLKTDVEFDIPPKKEVLVYAPLTTTQERYYTSLLNNTIESMVEEGRRKRLRELGWEKENCEQNNGEEKEEEEEWGVRKSKRLMNKSLK